MVEFQDILDGFFADVMHNVPNGSVWVISSCNNFAEFTPINDFAVSCDSDNKMDCDPIICFRIDDESRPIIIETFLNTSIGSDIKHQSIMYLGHPIFISYDGLVNNSLSLTLMSKLKQLAEYKEYGLINDELL